MNTLIKRSIQLPIRRHVSGSMLATSCGFFLMSYGAKIFRKSVCKKDSYEDIKHLEKMEDEFSTISMTLTIVAFWV